MQLNGLDIKLDRATAYVEARLRARRPRRDRRKRLDGTHWRRPRAGQVAQGTPTTHGTLEGLRPETGSPLGGLEQQHAGEG